ncbi:MAG: hypothetical protein MSP08_12740 [Clostridiales bacterium]|nr:hypothetical protein [Clostridiales bacterium]
MRIRIHPAFALYLLSMAVFSSWQMTLCAMGALLVHEAGHYAAARLLGERIAQVELTPFGGVMTYAPGKSPSKGIRGVFVAAAGPLGNALALLAASSPSVQRALGHDGMQAFIMANLAMLCLNLMPVLPLDGGNIVFSIGYYLFPAGRLIALLTTCGMVTGLGLALLALYGLIMLGTLNCSLLMIGGYLMLCARRSRAEMLAQNLYAVVQERQENPEGIRSMCLYRVPQDIRVQALLEPMERAPCAAFIFEDAQGIHIVGEKDVCRFLLDTPSLTLAQVWSEKRKPGGETQTKS